MNQRPIIELCCANIHSVVLAHEFDADAIELCCDLDHGGLTPSHALIQKARAVFRKEMAVFFRPRNGNFVYDALEKELILKDIEWAISEGIDTVVAGGMTVEASIDESFAIQLRTCSNLKKLSFHRAIDICKNPESQIQQLIDLKFDRILTSGCASKAAEGISTIRKWNQKFGTQIEFMAAGGIDHANARFILQESGLNRFHASVRINQISEKSIMDLGNEERADPEKVKKLFEVFGRLE